MAYTHTTFGTLKRALSLRLGDPSRQFWADSELRVLLIESLRTWSSLTKYHRARTGTLSTVSGTAFYDLEVEFSSLLDYTVTDTQVQIDLLYHLLEDPTVPYTGTDMFTQEDFTEALIRRRNQFLAETRIHLSTSSIAISWGSVSGRMSLTDTIVQIIRADYKSAADVYSFLYREDEGLLNDYNPTWNSGTTTPYAYSIVASPPVEIQIAPVPAESGTLESLVVTTGATLDPVTGVILGIPDDMAWVVKWGVLSDLLAKEGPSQDLSRSVFCESRYRIGVEVALQHSILVNVQLAGSPITSDPLNDLDKARVNWQNTTGTPDTIATASNVIAVSPVPDGVYAITADVVRPAPIPATDTDNVQVGREHLDTLLDYAEHLASFKLGMSDITRSEPLVKRFYQAATTDNQRLLAQSRALRDLMGQSTDEFLLRPYQTAPQELPRTRAKREASQGLR